MKKIFKICRVQTNRAMGNESSNNLGFNILTETRIEDDMKDSHKDDYESGKIVKEFGNLYTDNASILQSILEYYNKVGTDYFTSRELIKNHLIENCKVYRDKYSGSAGKTNFGSRVENINPRIVEALNKLTHLELVEDTPHIASNNMPTKKYRFTRLGIMIRFLLFYHNTDNKHTIADNYEQIYFHICSYYASLNHAHAKFCLIFFKNCYRNAKFIVVVIYLTKLLTSTSNNKYDFLFQIKFLNLLYWDMDLVNTYEESLNELSQNYPDVYNIVSLNIKLVIEELQESKAVYLPKFEVERLHIMEDIDKVVLEGFCEACNNFFIVSMKIIDYIKSLDEPHGVGTSMSKVKCTLCNNGYLDFQSYPNKDY